MYEGFSYMRKFENIKPGECFLYKNMVMLATSNECGVNAVCLKTGDTYAMRCNNVVSIVNLTFTISGW